MNNKFSGNAQQVNQPGVKYGPGLFDEIQALGLALHYHGTLCEIVEKAIEYIQETKKDNAKEQGSNE